jgi:hypothetical protein
MTLRLSMLLLLICALATAQEGRYDWNAAPARLLYPGLQLAQLETATPRALRLHCLRIATSTPGLRFTTTGRCPDWDDSAQETLRESARDFLRRNRAQGLPLIAAVNADAFAPWPAPWNESTPTNLQGLAIANGTLVSSASGTPSLLIDRNGRIRMQRTDRTTALADITLAVSGFGFCLHDGEAPASSNDLHPRTGIGLSENGQYLLWLVIDGRRHASIGATIQETGLWLRHFGAHNGINMDGGGSSTLVWWNPDKEGDDKTELLNEPVGDGKDWREFPRLLERMLWQPTERRNGNHLGVYFEPPAPAPTTR